MTKRNHSIAPNLEIYAIKNTNHLINFKLNENMKYQALKKEYYAVYEKEPRHQDEQNGVILSPFTTKEEAEQARVKYGYGDDNYYVDKYSFN